MTTEKNVTMQDAKGQVVLYKNRLEVRLEKDTVWLTQKQLSELFNTERSVVTKHLQNVFNSGELEEKSNVQKMHIANSDKPVAFYSLDVIISIGYRVNSKQGTQFRIWATNVLRQHLVAGYTINEKRLKAQQGKIKELQETVRLLGNVVLLDGVNLIDVTNNFVIVTQNSCGSYVLTNHQILDTSIIIR